MELTRREFETLPPTLRRKCLSTDEHQRYTQAYGARPDPQPKEPANRREPAPASRHQSYFARDFLHPKPPQSRVKPALHPHDRSASRPSSSGRQQIRPLTASDISREDALFFSRLPEKLQRRQFSAAERQLLAAKQYPPPPPPLERRTVAYTAEDRLHAVGKRAANRSLPSLSSTISGRSSPGSYTTDDLETLRTEEDMDDDYTSSSPWIEESKLDLGLDDYHLHLANVAKALPEPKLYPAPAPPLSPARRNRSFTGFALARVITKPAEKKSTMPETHIYRGSLDAKVTRMHQGNRPVVPPLPLLPASSATVPAPQPSPLLKETSIPQPSEARIPKVDRLASKAEMRASVAEKRASGQLDPPSHEQWRGTGWKPPSEWWQPLPKSAGTPTARKSSAPISPVTTEPPLAIRRRVSASSMAPTAEHYMNPDARLKLRMYLASPAKFDEALQYGFPTLPSPTTPTSPLRPHTSSRNSMPPRPSRSRTVGGGTGSARPRRGPTHSHSLTFLRDETTPEVSVDGRGRPRPRTETSRAPSSLGGAADTPDPANEADVEDEGEHTETADTPEAREPDQPGRQLDDDEYADPGELSSPGLTATSPGLTESSAEFDDAAGEREMTLRMTLTRPELRSDDAALYPPTAHLVAPQTRFIGRGPGRKPAPGAPMDALSMEKLFDDEPVAVKSRGGFRRLFSRKW